MDSIMMDWEEISRKFIGWRNKEYAELFSSTIYKLVTRILIIQLKIQLVILSIMLLCFLR